MPSMMHSLAVRRTLCVAAAMIASAAGSTLCASPVLNNDGSLMTTTHLARTTFQDCLPLWWNRGTDLEGAVRFGGDVPASPGFNTGMGAATMGGIELASLGFSLSEVDMALPTNGPAVVIGRSFNHRQGSDTSVAASDGLQGFNWFQSAMPELSLWTGGGSNADDVLYLVYGANRFMEFKRTALNATTFRGVNGTTGVVEYVAGNNSTTYDTYTITDQNGWSWVFWGNVTGTKADWQLWKKTDPQGLTVYAGDKTTHGTAISSGYATNGGFSTLYQEFGDPSSPTERRYTFTYSSVASKDRLTEVKAEIKSGGTWGSPSGLTEIGRVSYAYYTTKTYNGHDADDFYGNNGDLKTVKIAAPLTDSGSSLSSGIYSERTKYYRYYDTYNVLVPANKGHIHALKLIVGFEGCRKFDWTDNATFDDSLNNTGATEETSVLKSFSEAFYEYETATGTQRISAAVFNGECGCGGSGGAAGPYSFASSANGSYTDNTSAYDTAWCVRTLVTQPDGTYQVRYFDEIGQPLSTVVTTNTGGSTHWVTGVDRDSNGRVTTVHSPANLNAYTHSTGAITYLSSSSTGGLITNYGRVSSTDRAGLLESTGYQTGTGGSNQLLSETTFGQRDASVAGVTLSKPIIATSKAYFGTGGSDYDTTTYTFAWWSGTNTNPLYVTPQSITTTLPVVKSSTPDQNGDGGTYYTYSYLRKDGRTAISVAPDGIITAMTYNAMGLPLRTVRDANPDKPGGSYTYPGDFDSGYGPSDFSMSTSDNGGLRYATEASYDNVGRTVTSTVRPDASTPVKRIAETFYGRLADGRLASISFPRQASPGGTLTYYGPASYSVSNHAGGSEFSCTLGVSSTTASKANWLDEAYSDPLYALENASGNFAGSSRVNVFGIGTTVYNDSGSKATERRAYHTFATSSTWTGSAGTNYDATSYSYDSMGRADKVTDATGTISRTMFDALGRVSSRWIGTSDSSWPPVASTSAAGNMVQTELAEYDSGGVGNGYVTKRTAYVSGDTYGFGSSTGKRETVYKYDVRGRAVVVEPPLPPCTVTAYDLRNRVTAVAQFSAGGLSVSTDPATSGTLSTRTALSKSFYDSRGQVYKTERWKIDQSDGSDDDSLESLTWRDPVGRVIKQGGTGNSKTAYDRLGRPTHQYTLARNNDSGYSDADDVSGDIVLEQSDTVYDDVDKTGLVVMTASLMRNHDDTSTIGALDTNADNNVYKYTQTGTPDVKGRIQITAYWYDELDRQQDVVQYGTYNYGDFDRYPSSVWLTVPSRSATALRTTTVYNDNGTVQTSKAPKEIGGNAIETRWLYDQAMRKKAEIRNHTGAGSGSGYTTTVTPPERDTDVYTRYTYDAGRLKTIWVDFDGDNVVDAGDQVTQYNYGTTKGTSAGQSAIASNVLLDNVKYPERVSGESTADRSNYFAYDAQGAKVYFKDNNGTVLTYTYDDLGRKQIETVAALGGSTDGTVRRCEWEYEDRGLLSTVTQFDATGGGNDLDGVLYKYDGWGNLTDFRQDPSSKVSNGSPNDLDVHYTYTKASTTSAVSGTRRSGLRRSTAELYYGMGVSGSGTKNYEVSYSYLTSDSGDTLYDDDIGRVTYQNRTYGGSTVTLTDFRYGGTGLMVSNYLAESQVKDERAWPGTSGWDLGYDRFTRPIRTFWYKNAAGGIVYVDQRVSYDDNSNVTTNENGWVTPWSATYESDGLNRLKGLKFGVYSGGSISTVVQQEDWVTSGTLKLSQTGNWVDYKRQRTITATSTKDDWQASTFTDTNVLKMITAKSGTNDYDQTSNKKGMPTKDDTNKGGAETTVLGYNYVYDAWDRLVTVKDAANTNVVEEFRYNGLGHRIGWHYDWTRSGGGAPDGRTDGDDPWTYLQYNEKWQQVASYRAGKADPWEVFVYVTAGLDGYGGSSYIDDCVLRERDDGEDGDLDKRLYYLQNWRHDVAALITDDGIIKEKVVYDAYGRPHSFSPADISDGTNNRPDGVVDASDVSAWSTGSVAWNKDIGTSGSVARPDGTVHSTQETATITALIGYTGGWDKLGESATGNRKGYAGYEFDNILQGTGGQDARPLYHVRHRVLASDTGKWFQKDPLGYHDSMDLYEYCASKPINLVDSYGTCFSPATNKAVSSTQVAVHQVGSSATGKLALLKASAFEFIASMSSQPESPRESCEPKECTVTDTFCDISQWPLNPQWLFAGTCPFGIDDTPGPQVKKIIKAYLCDKMFQMCSQDAVNQDSCDDLSFTGRRGCRCSSITRVEGPFLCSMPVAQRFTIPIGSGCRLVVYFPRNPAGWGMSGSWTVARGTCKMK